MAKNLIFEIGTEEMPADSMKIFRENYLKTAAAVFKNNNLEYREINVYSTPRRLVLEVADLLEKQKDNREIVRGPAADIAFTDNGKATKAGEGFARGQGVKVEDLIEKEGYIYAEKVEKGEKTVEIIADILKEIINQLSLPKAMRWGSVNMEFIRPIKWLLLLFGEQELKIEIAGVKSSNFSKGHRFLSEGKVKINNTEEYFSSLKTASIIVDQNKRKEIITAQIKELDLAAEPVIKESLLTEVVDLIEYPTAFKGVFSEEYLSLPTEVLITAMEKHQRYFPVMTADGKLKAEFVGVRDGGTDYLDQVTAGNEMVLRGRLDDAQFFFAEDQKYGFLNRTKDIKNIVFQKDIGSVYQKVEKLQLLTAEIADILNYDKKSKKLAIRAAELSKNDLATEMVNEFPNLQGLMGREYAVLEGEEKETAAAIYEHYLPRFAGDNLPESKTGVAVAMAEKLFNLGSHFLLGNIPSGSQDPFALRRQATGFLRIILAKKLTLNINQLIEITLEIIAINPANSTAAAELKEFIKQRLENILKDENVRYDIINAVLNRNDQDLLDIYNRAHKLMDFRAENSKLFVDLIRALVRSKNISQKSKNKSEIKAGLLVENEEKELYRAFKQRKDKIEKLINSDQYQQAFYLLVELKTDIDQFLDNVMVMVEDQEIKNNRLTLLAQISKLMSEVMDIEEIALD